MTWETKTLNSVTNLRNTLERLEALVRGPNASPADFTTRDRVARRLREAVEGGQQ